MYMAADCPCPVADDPCRELVGRGRRSAGLTRFALGAQLDDNPIFEFASVREHHFVSGYVLSSSSVFLY
jgi:hypothetical protein